MISKIESLFTRHEIAQHFGRSEGLYDEFVSFQFKKWSQIFPRCPDEVVLFEPNNWEDAGNNIHVSWSGEVTIEPYTGELKIEAVWLKRLACFRGHVFDNINGLENWEQIHAAKEQFRLNNYSGCIQYLKNVGNGSLESYSVSQMKKIAKERINNAS